MKTNIVIDISSNPISGKILFLELCTEMLLASQIPVLFKM